MVDSAGRFTLRRWADGLAVFDRRTGATHCMNPASGAVFERLASDPTTADDVLLRGIADNMPQASEAAHRDALAEALERLRAARLIER